MMSRHLRSAGSPAASRNQTETGLILTEALVALAVLAIAISTVLLIANQTVSRATSIERQAIILVRTRSLLERVGLDLPSTTGRQAGDFGDSLNWEIMLTPASDEPTSKDGTQKLIDVIVAVHDGTDRANDLQLHQLLFVR